MRGFGQIRTAAQGMDKQLVGEVWPFTGLVHILNVLIGPGKQRCE